MMNAVWYRSSLTFISFLLLPFSFLFRVIIFLRKLCYRFHIFKVTSFSAPIIVVGNIAVGGTGKTPFVIWLIACLRAKGFRPGVVSRGYGGMKHVMPHLVLESDSAHVVGDEPKLISNRTNVPVVVCVDRVKAVHYLLHHSNCNIVVSDDGLQHYSMSRDVEIILVDAERQFGNRQLLPTGPLREPLSRLKEASLVIETGGKDAHLDFTRLVSLLDGKEKKDIPKKAHAVSGIAHPEQFFKTLRMLNIDIIPHIFPDHHHYVESDLDFKEDLPILMTEKDAVKCRVFAKENMWYLEVKLVVSDLVANKVNEIIQLHTRSHT